MSDFPEKTPETEEMTEEQSTVFSAPQAHKKTAPNKKKRLLPVILAVFLAVAVLAGGTVAVIKLIPEKKQDGEGLPAPKIETVSLVEEKPEDLKTVTVRNENGTYKLYAEQQDQTVTWYAEGFAKEETDTDALADIVEKAAAVTVLKKEVQLTKENCELDEEHAIAVDVQKNDGTAYALRIGKESMDDTGTYLTVSGDETIYIATSPQRDDFDFKETEFLQAEEEEPKVDKAEIPSDYTNDDGSVATFDKLTLSGENFPETVVIKPNTDSTVSQFAAFMVTEPDERMADKVDELLVLYADGVTYNALYSETASTGELQKYGLDKPDLKVETVFGKTTVVHRFKKQADGNYAVFREGGNRILSVAAANIPYVEYDATHYYAKWVFMQSINDLSSMTVKSKDESYTFSIQYNGEEADEKYVIKVGDKKITAEHFQDYYQECLLIPSVDFTTVETTAAPEYTLVLTYSDPSRSPMTVEYTPISETRYQYSINKKPMGQVTATKLSSLMSGAAKVAKDRSIK